MRGNKSDSKSSTRSSSEDIVSPDSDSSSILLVIANIGPANRIPDDVHKRKKAFAGLLKSEEPDIVLVQELTWSDKRDDENNWVIWMGIDTPKQYEHVRYNEYTQASVVFDKNKFTVKVPQGKEITNFIKKMRDEGKIPGIPPQERMCIVEIKSKSNPNAHFLCISWHGYYNNKRSDEEKEEDLSNLFIFIQEISKQMKLPFIIGGEFNLNDKKLRDRFENTDGIMFLYDYEPLEHRKGKVIDFYVTSKHLPLDDVAAIDWKSVKDGKAATKMFNHNPVIAILPTKRGLKTSATKFYHLSY